MLILTLRPEFEQVYSVVKRFAQLASEPLSSKVELHTCSECGFPMVKPIDGGWKCEGCLVKEEYQDLVF